jgi:hypothetical protein
LYARCSKQWIRAGLSGQPVAFRAEALEPYLNRMGLDAEQELSMLDDIQIITDTILGEIEKNAETKN